MHSMHFFLGGGVIFDSIDSAPSCHFQELWGEITKKAYFSICPKIREILSIPHEP